jgi:prevent-host-death family protein
MSAPSRAFQGGGRAALLGDREAGVSPPIAEVASGGYLNGVRTVSLKILKNKLSQYVRLAAAGETIVVTDRGRREGWITPATDRSGTPRPCKPLPGYTLEQLLADLDKDREDRW